MIMVVVCAALAGWLLVRPAPERTLRRLGPRGQPAALAPGDGGQDDHGRLAGSPGGRVGLYGWVAGGLLVVLVAGLVDQTRGLALALALLAVTWTGGRLLRQWWAGRAADRQADAIGHACQVLAGQVRIGQVPATALTVAAEDCPVLAEAAAVQRLGGDVPASWRRTATRPGCGGLLQLARAWEVSRRTGAELAPALERVATNLEQERRIDVLVAGELAAPRATAKLLGVLPAMGVVIGLALGGDPVDFLTSHPVGQACLVAGVLLACAGVLWVDRLARTEET
ncbi:type II secretion system F family protein [Microlunatus sp. Y2014]|uniref:type II secretion system F family protein n=1 Tax=Microlunatus sp. Y2014 TaxID=3418488 RepID=UPI003DA7912E